LCEDGSVTDRLRFTVPEAARVLGISPEAVRNRLSRGTLDSVKEGGTVYVLIDRHVGRPQTDIPTDILGESTALISAKDETIAVLREQLEAERQAHAEARRLLAAALDRIPPQLEAPPDASGSPETATEAPGRGEPRDQEHVPWWRRWFQSL
jgi:DNA-binding Lrp family transcriptional regulator